MKERRGDVARRALLELHRTLIEVERRAYERVHGRVTPAALLDHLIHHPTFAWLRPLAEAIAEGDHPVDAHGAAVADTSWPATVRALLTPDPARGEFQRRYAERLQESPELAFAHGAAMRSLPR